jgi:hypothetical protein
LALHRSNRSGSRSRPDCPEKRNGIGGMCFVEINCSVSRMAMQIEGDIRSDTLRPNDLDVNSSNGGADLRVHRMADFDIRRSAEAIAELLSNYFEQFLLLLTKPRTAIRAQFEQSVSGKKRVRIALIYAACSILLGICLARFIGLPKSPKEVSPQTAVAILIVWILFAAVLHPFLKLFRAKGVLQDTVVVFLLVISTLHLLFIPLLAVASRLLTDTQVTLSYDYVIYFGPDVGPRAWGMQGMRPDDIVIWLQSQRDWRRKLVGEHTETFIKEKQPERDRTVLTPTQDLSAYFRAEDVPLSPENRVRVSPSTVALQGPSRSETTVVREGAVGLLSAFWLIYYVTNSAYLAACLSVPHQRNPYFLFFLSVIAPFCFALLILAAIVLYGWLVNK